MFVAGGLDALQHPEGKVKAAEKVIRPIAQHTSVLPDDTVTVVRMNGAVQLAAGVMLSLGILRRTAAALLIGSLVPTTVAGHRFWEELDERARSQQVIHFFKNLGMLGGLVLVATEAPARMRRRSIRSG
jgi:uncharacterized membrane protein YphA (DoxX/SURF4 family)